MCLLLVLIILSQRPSGLVLGQPKPGAPTHVGKQGHEFWLRPLHIIDWCSSIVRSQSKGLIDKDQSNTFGACTIRHDPFARKRSIDMSAHRTKIMAAAISGLLLCVVLVGWFIVNDWTLVLIGAVTLGLSISPYVFAKRLGVELPLAYLALTLLFAFASIFLGEVFEFYERVWWWDLFLHLTSGIGFGLIGFLLVFIMFKGDRYAAPRLAICGMSFVFAVAIGTFWELFEFGMDEFLDKSMQKTGRDDTMTDILMNTLGAGLGSLFNYSYLLGDRSGLPSRLLHVFIKNNAHLYSKATKSPSEK